MPQPKAPNTFTADQELLLDCLTQTAQVWRVWGSTSITEPVQDDPSGFPPAELNLIVTLARELFRSRQAKRLRVNPT